MLWSMVSETQGTLICHFLLLCILCCFPHLFVCYTVRHIGINQKIWPRCQCICSGKRQFQSVVLNKIFAWFPTAVTHVLFQDSWNTALLKNWNEHSKHAENANPQVTLMWDVSLIEYLGLVLINNHCVILATRFWIPKPKTY